MSTAVLGSAGPAAGPYGWPAPDPCDAPDAPAADFRAAMSALAAPVTVVTAYDAQGGARGLTASAVSSLSLTPPLFLVCLDHGSRTHDALTGAPAFCVNVLGPGDESLARQFSGPAEQRFAGVRLAPGPGPDPHRPPGLAAAALRLTCARWELAAGGDHTVLIGRVTGIEGDTGSAGGLLWHRRGFAHALPSAG
ncbi:flavin reductase family protein [Streptomyces sp. JJ36]|uniref:flavin reductase family protein n=1 Tax=Streptomyces sp. JJ36 TaxID=2736645 RepID=UPI001F2937F0|nr:flavin reductase family protein [Streptomyces sp. JJ36]MCF6524771.1 flavin reductase family protein [Streptomyces sp. JJ36]